MNSKLNSGFVASTHDPKTFLGRVLSRRQEIRAAATRRGLKDIRLFGSVARGDTHPGSDIDILATTKEGSGLFQLAMFQADLEEMLKAPIHVSSTGGMTDEERQSVHEHAIVL